MLTHSRLSNRKTFPEEKKIMDIVKTGLFALGPHLT